MDKLDDAFVAQVFESIHRDYQRIKSIYAETGYDREYPLNYFWGGGNMRELLEIISSPLSVQEKIAAVHRTSMFSVNTDDEKIKNLMVDWYLEYFNSSGIPLQELNCSIQESPFSNPDNAVWRNGRLLAPDFLRTVILCWEIKRYCRFHGGKFNAVELGAGYGGLARSFKLFFPEASYAIIDIPETLFFSYLFLRLNFPHAKVCLVTDPADLTQPLSAYDFVFVPTKFAEVLLGYRFELFCNTASLGEMKNSVIRHWMDFVENKLNVHYFFGLNRFLNTIDPGDHLWRLEENECSVLFDDRWRILQWELEPPFTRCPYFETQVTRNLEIIAERSPQKFRDPAKEQNVSRSVEQDLAKQDWFLHAGDTENTMRLRDFSLAPDLTMKGNLFKLWESIRLEPRVDNVSMMLIFLVTLMRRNPFEEIFYYLGLLEKLEENQKSPNPLEKPDTPLISLTLRQAEIINLIRESGVSLREEGGAGSTKPKKFSPYMYHVLAYWGRPKLTEEGYKGYNIILYLDKYYGMAQSLGSLDFTQMEEQILERYKADGTCVVGKELDETKRLIDKLDFRSTPELVEEGYWGFNIVRYKREAYAISLSLGPVDLTRVEPSTLQRLQKTGNCFIAGTVAEVKGAVDLTRVSPPARENVPAKDLDIKPIRRVESDDEVKGPSSKKALRYDKDPGVEPALSDLLKPPLISFENWNSPELVESNYRGFNLVHYGGRCFALALSLGPVDLPEIDEKTLKDYQESGQCIVGISVDEVKQWMDQRFLSTLLHRVESNRCQKNYLEGVKILRQAVNFAPNSPEVLALLGVLSVELGNPGLAQKALSRIQTIAPSYPAVSALQKGLETQNLEMAADPPSVEMAVPRRAFPRKEKALFICNIPSWKSETYLSGLQDFDITLLSLNGEGGQWADYPHINLPDVFSAPPQMFQDGHFDVVVMPYENRLFWGNHNLVRFSASFAKKVFLLFSNGKVRCFGGENLHRLEYNTAYLHSMFRFVPSLKGKKVLEIGCSDGLVCDLLTNENPEEVIGVDVLDTVGCSFKDPKISYKKMDGTQLSFDGRTMDLCYSIATLEHCKDPFAVLREMKRVTQKGGYGYVQAGPLYYSPFGHHMFGCFDDFPWIHLRLSKDEIVDYGKARGIDRKLRNDRGMELRQYVEAMLNREHINEKSLREYGLEEFMEQPELEVLNFSRSYEGKGLLDAKILKELSHIPGEDLISHGFELVFRVR